MNWGTSVRKSASCKGQHESQLADKLKLAQECNSQLQSEIETLKETPLVSVHVFLCASVEEWWTLNEWKVRSPNTSETSVSRALPQVFSTTLEHIRSRTLTHNHEWCFECEPSGPDYSVTTWSETDGQRTHTNNILIEKEINLIKKG